MVGVLSVICVLVYTCEPSFITIWFFDCFIGPSFFFITRDGRVNASDCVVFMELCQVLFNLIWTASFNLFCELFLSIFMASLMVLFAYSILPLHWGLYADVIRCLIWCNHAFPKKKGDPMCGGPSIQFFPSNIHHNPHLLVALHNPRIVKWQRKVEQPVTWPP